MKSEQKVTKELVDRMIEIHFPFSWNLYEVTVMEMLDIIKIPLHHRLSIDKMFDIDDWEWYKVSFYSSEHFNDLIRWFQWTLPNALAEIVLWLHENNYITFK